MLNLHHARRLADKLGAGLITGAADDDPSGLATYSQAGAQFGAGLLWTLALTAPLMISIQMVSARIGWFTGQGLAASIRRLMPPWMTLCTVLPLWLGFDAMVRVLKWLTLALLAYVAVVFMLHVNWETVLTRTLLPQLQANGPYWMMVVAVLGTTISPYLFFWQAAQEAEQRQRLDALADNGPHVAETAVFAREHLYRIKLDTIVGMVFSNLIAFCVMLATALTLNQHGIADIQTTKQAAEALRPLAGDFAFTLFALGIIGTGMLAVPVLAASSAYAVADAFQWRSGLDKRLIEARGFFTVIALGTVVGTLVGFTPLDPIKALVWSAIVNGVIAVPIMAVMMWLGMRRDILGDNTLTRRHQVLGWFATAVMAVAVVAMLVTG